MLLYNAALYVILYITAQSRRAAAATLMLFLLQAATPYASAPILLHMTLHLPLAAAVTSGYYAGQGHILRTPPLLPSDSRFFGTYALRYGCHGHYTLIDAARFTPP